MQDLIADQDTAGAHATAAKRVLQQRRAPGSVQQQGGWFVIMQQHEMKPDKIHWDPNGALFQYRYLILTRFCYVDK